MVDTEGDQEDPENEESEDDEEQQFVANAEQRINAAFLGTFSTRNIKRKPKEEKILLDMDNVFMKLGGNGWEVYYPKISYELSKSEISQVKF